MDDLFAHHRARYCAGHSGQHAFKLFGEFVVANLLIGGSFETVQIYLYLIMKQTGHLSSAVVVIYVFIMTIICAAVMKLSSGKKENMQLKEEKP